MATKKKTAEAAVAEAAEKDVVTGAEEAVENEEVKPAKKPTRKTVSKKSAAKKPVPAPEEEAEEMNEFEEDQAEEIDDGDMPSDEEIAAVMAEALKTVLKRRASKSATRKERKELYGGGVKVSRRLGASEEEIALTREEKIRKEYQLLAAATRSSKQIVEVHIDGMEQNGTYGYVMTSRLADREIGEFKIMIPANELFIMNLKDWEGYQDPTKKMEQELERYIGCNVRTLIYTVDEKERVAFASRLAASAVITENCFRKKDKKGRPMVQPGMIRTGTILFPKRDRLIVEVDGIDMTIKTEEASWNTLQSLYEEFHYGEKVNVKILEVDPDVVTEVNGKILHLAKATGSIRQAENDPQKIYFDDFVPEERYEGVVKNIVADGKIFVRLCGKLDCICDTPAVDRVQVGQAVVVKLKRTYQNTNHMMGQIVQIHH